MSLALAVKYRESVDHRYAVVSTESRAARLDEVAVNVEIKSLTAHIDLAVVGFLCHDVGVTLQNDRRSILIACRCRLSDYHVVLRIALILKSARLREIHKIFDDSVGVARASRNCRDLTEQIEKIRILIVSRYIKHIIASLSINLLAFYHKKREFSSVSLTFSPESCTIKEKTEKRRKDDHNRKAF